MLFIIVFRLGLFSILKYLRGFLPCDFWYLANGRELTDFAMHGVYLTDDEPRS